MPPEETGTAPATQQAPPAVRNQQPATESIDDVLGEILKEPAPKGAADDETESEPDAGDVADTGNGEAEDSADAEGEDSDADDSGDADDGDAEEDDSAPADDEPDAKTLKAARKAADEGDLDKAFQLAFGKKPEELQPNTKVWTAWRKANDRKDAQLAAERQAVQREAAEGRQWVEQQRQLLHQTINELKPYDAFFQLKQAFKRDGDPAHLVKLLELGAEMSYDDAQKLILTKTRRSPTERALQERLDAIERQRQEDERKRQEERKQQQQQQAYQNDLAIIRGQLTGEITRVPRYDQRIYQVLLQTKLPTGGLSMTVEEAGRRVLAAERRKLEKHPLLNGQRRQPPKKVSEAAATLAKARAGKKAPAPPLRRDSHGNGAIDEKTETIDDILGDILPKGGKARPLAHRGSQ